jgi:hypothetical protein
MEQSPSALEINDADDTRILGGTVLTFWKSGAANP